MQSKHFGQVIQWDVLLNEVDVRLTVTVPGHVVCTTWAQLVILYINHIAVIVVCKHIQNQASILRISHTTTVVCLSYHINKGLEGDLIIEVKELDELFCRDAEIGCRELVSLVPAKGTVLSSIKDDGIEEAETPEETAEGNRFLARFKVLLASAAIRLKNVLLKTLRRFRGHLCTVLYDRHWELVRRLCSHPDSERSFSIILDLLDESVELRHEGWSQVTVLEHNPSSHGACLSGDGLSLADSIDSFLRLTATQRERLDCNFLLG